MIRTADGNGYDCRDRSTTSTLIFMNTHVQYIVLVQNSHINIICSQNRSPSAVSRMLYSTVFNQHSIFVKRLHKYISGRQNCLCNSAFPNHRIRANPSSFPLNYKNSLNSVVQQSETRRQIEKTH